MTDEDDIVFDPYLGVGTTAIAALMHGRKALGCDTSQEYIDIAKWRIRELKRGTLQLRPMGKPIYDPSKPNGGH